MITSEAQELILKDTISFYNSNNRSVSDINQLACRYNGINGKKCAAARYMNFPENAKEFKNIDSRINWELLNDTAKLAGKEFMLRIQHLHDTQEYWNETGLSEIGHQQVKLLCYSFSININ